MVCFSIQMHVICIRLPREEEIVRVGSLPECILDLVFPRRMLPTRRRRIWMYDMLFDKLLNRTYRNVKKYVSGFILLTTWIGRMNNISTLAVTAFRIYFIFIFKFIFQGNLHRLINK